MARRAKPAAAKAANLIETLQMLAAAHGMALEIPPDEAMVPGSAVRLCVAGPHSIERFVTEARNHPHIRDVQVLSTHIALEIVVPDEAGQ